MTGDEFYYKGVRPTAKVDQEIVKLFYAIGYSLADNDAIYTAEHLTKESVETHVKRRNEFHEDTSISTKDEMGVESLVHTGYDKGHITPSGDMPTRQDQYQSFSMANMYPETPEMNRVAWAKGPETKARLFAKLYGEVYVITGKIGSLGKINGVIIPEEVYKVIYAPKQNKLFAFIVTNTDHPLTYHPSLSDLENILKYKVLPGIK